jgi:hypothetical protein
LKSPTDQTAVSNRRSLKSKDVRRLPAMKRRMTFLHRHERPSASRANFPAGSQSSFDHRFAPLRFDNLRGKKNRPVSRRRPQEFDRVIRGDGAGRPIFAAQFHQMPGRRPVAVTIKQCADDPAVQNAGKRFVFLLRFPFRYDFIATDEAADMEPVRIRRSATEAGVLRRVKLLERLRFAASHDYFAPFPADPGYGRNSGPV